MAERSDSSTLITYNFRSLDTLIYFFTGHIRVRRQIMRTDAWHYSCQEENDEEYDQEKERQAYIEESPEDDLDDDEEMDEM